jgi:integrase
MSRGVRLPPYARHASGQAKVRIAGKDFYLGPHGTPESRERYERVVAEWVAQGTPRPWSGPCRAAPSAGGGSSIAELMLRYLRFVPEQYQKDGHPTSEVVAVNRALTYVHRLYSRVPVGEFGPLALKACREAMVSDKLARTTVNGYVGRIRRMIRWGTENELVPAGIYQALMAVAGLRRGRTEAREPTPIRPVEAWCVEMVLPNVSRQVAAMIELQLLTGMRPGEVIQMRTCDLSVSEDVWRYRPASHKTEHHGKGRVVLIGPRAQEVVRPFLRRELQRPLFSPRDAEEERVGALREAASHPRQPSALVEKQDRFAELGDAYTVGAYRRAIRRACDALAVVPWHPHQLRHNAATAIRSAYGIESARVVLGHASVETSEIYAERDEERAAEIMRKIG